MCMYCFEQGGVTSSIIFLGSPCLALTETKARMKETETLSLPHLRDTLAQQWLNYMLNSPIGVHSITAVTLSIKVERKTIHGLCPSHWFMICRPSHSKESPPNFHCSYLNWLHSTWTLEEHLAQRAVRATAQVSWDYWILSWLDRERAHFLA